LTKGQPQSPTKAAPIAIEAAILNLAGSGTAKKLRTNGTPTPIATNVLTATVHDISNDYPFNICKSQATSNFHVSQDSFQMPYSSYYSALSLGIKLR
jgi:hypothetical protein